MNRFTIAVLPLCAASLLAQGTPEIEPNDSASLATPLVIGHQGDGAISGPGDVDLWRITLTTSSDLRFWVNPGVGAAIADSDLTLIGPDGTTELQINDDALSPASLLSAVVAGNLLAGDYFLRVRSSQAHDPSGTGTYTIDVIAAPPGTYLLAAPGSPSVLTQVYEGPEINDPRLSGGVATPSVVNSIHHGTIAAGTPGLGFANPGADYDFFRLDVTRAGLLTVATLPGAAYPALRDSVIFLVDQTL